MFLQRVLASVLFGGLIAATGLLSTAQAAPCGTIAAPAACSVTVGGNVTYSFTNFTFEAASASGGGNLYDGADVGIDVATGGGLTGLLTFSKVQDAQGIVFLVNPGETTSFSFSYDVTVTTVLPGVFAFTDRTASMIDSAAGNGFVAVQFIVNGQGNCLIGTTDDFETCATTGAGPLDVGGIATLTGLSGNASIGSFAHLFNGTFTPDDGPPAAGVPAPAGAALLLSGLIGCVAFRARRKQ